jgi:hypothetical protein
MTPGKLNLIIFQGTTFRRVIRLQDTTVTPAVPIDLSGATVRMHIRAAISDTATLLELNETNGRAVISDALNGEITLLVTAAITAALDFLKAVYDLEIQYSNGTVDRVLQGGVTLSKEVTR